MIQPMKKVKNIFKKGSAQPHFYKSKSGAGFVILFAVTLSSILLSIALGVANIALKEVKFGTSAKDTNDAFFAADTGIEYVLFNDKPPSIYTAPGTWNVTVPGLGSAGTSCAKVNVTKTGPPSIRTTIISKGYNTGDSSCNPTNSNRIERELLITY